MRRHDRAALRVQSLEPIAQKSAGRSRTGLLLAPSAMPMCLSCIADGRWRRPVVCQVAIDAM
jgi:hypothetical protein